MKTKPDFRMTRPPLPALVLAAAISLLTGCAVHTPPVDVALNLPGSFRQACGVQQRAASAPGLDEWWRGFQDDALTRAVERAVADNPSLALARARLDQAQALASVVGADRLPRLDATASSTAVRQSLNDPLARLASAIPGFEREYVHHRIGARASWEVDLFGGTRALRDAALADAAAAAESTRAVRTGLAAEVSDTYLRLRTAQARQATAREQEALARRLVELVSQRVDQGFSARRELDSAQAVLEGVLAAMPPLRTAVEAELAQLDVLMGAAPGTHRRDFEADAPLPAAPGIAAAQGPAALMRRRPDLRVAELRLAASHARIAAALAEYYPKLSLSALAGWNSAVAGRVFGSDSFGAEIGPALRWRLFDFGRVDAEVALARGREAEALAGYRAAVFAAAAEVETAMATLLNEEARAAALGRQLDRLRSARGLAFSAYSQGALSLLEVLDLDRQLLAVADQQTLARAGAARAAVASFRALGGGWQAPADAAAASPGDGGCRAPAYRHGQDPDNEPTTARRDNERPE
jgi:NodT family efflux transporter outer membrane factor (OMF) lipoprotein